jgi:hypothetical protein
MNLPNSITMSRIVMIPLLLWILSPHFPWQGNGAQEIVASVLFVLASITDGLDGYLARRRGQITTMGMLLDPLADKIMVTGAIIALVAYNPQIVKVWIAVVIVAREFVISGLALHRFVRGLYHPGQRPGQIEDRCPDRLRHLRHPRPPLGSVADRCARHTGTVVCRSRHLLRGGGLRHLRDRLLHRLLEADRPRLQGQAQNLNPRPAQKR